VQPVDQAIELRRQKVRYRAVSVTRSVCGVPAGTKTVVPAGASTSRSANLNRSDPSSTCHASSSER
jgi:hypothetical protein